MCRGDLKPYLHCQRAAVKASQVLGLIRRCFKINSVDMLVFLFKMYVRPILSAVYRFGTLIWPKISTYSTRKSSETSHQYLHGLTFVV